MVLPILTFPNDILRKPAERVLFPLSPEIKKLTKNMIETVRSADGIGLAAPQVGKSVKVIVINLEKSQQTMKAFPLYNARIKKKIGKKLEVDEGCLSLPGVYGFVKRPKQVTIEYQDENGETVQLTDNAWISRIAQHEIDHTNGTLIIDLIKKYTQGEDIVKGWKKQGLI